MHFFITGHTGFKGSWLILLLRELGHEVSGYSLQEVRGGLFDLAALEDDLKHHYIGDIRDYSSLRCALDRAKPDFAIHMAAQPLVLRSYENPIETFTVNVDGTRNFLEAITSLEKPPKSLVVTTDKVYRDSGKLAYVESDPLGGHDPYSASKAMADILTQSWINTHPELKLGIARAGNVIGAFDQSANRLIPDMARALASDRFIEIRNPDAVRPWQHVLDCLWGYFLFLENIASKIDSPIALNFGPNNSNIASVSDVVRIATKVFPELNVHRVSNKNQNRETSHLTLDSSLAREYLNWNSTQHLEPAVIGSLKTPSLDKSRDFAVEQVRSFLTRSELQA